MWARKIAGHHRDERERLPRPADEPAEHEDDRERQHDDQQQVEHVGESGRVLERVRAAGPVQAAAVGAEQLDDLHGGDRAAGDLLGPAASVAAVRKPVKFWTAPWLTITSAPMTDSGTNTRTRDRVRSTQKLPIRARRSRDAADHGQRHRQPDGGGGELGHHQPGHVGEVAGLGLALVGLPVGAGDEADRGVERQQRRHARGVGRVQRQHSLQPQDHVQQEGGQQPEDQYGDRVDLPGHGVVRVHPQGPVDEALDRQEDPVTGRPCSGGSAASALASGAVAECGGQVAAEQRRQAPRSRRRRRAAVPSPVTFIAVPSSARLSSRTFTAGSPRKPHCGAVVYWCTRAITWAAARCRARATRGAWSRAFATEISGSRPEPEAVTASTGTGASAAVELPVGEARSGTCRSQRRAAAFRVPLARRGLVTGCLGSTGRSRVGLGRERVGADGCRSAHRVDPGRTR